MAGQSEIEQLGTFLDTPPNIQGTSSDALVPYVPAETAATVLARRTANQELNRAAREEGRTGQIVALRNTPAVLFPDVARRLDFPSG